MSVSSNLYLSNRWSFTDIKDCIETIIQKRVNEVRILKDDPGFSTLSWRPDKQDYDENVHVILDSQSPVGRLRCILTYPDNIPLLKKVAEVLGGLLEESDAEGKLEFFDGKANEDDKLPYHIKYAIINDGIDPDDIDALKESIEKWEKKVRG